MYIRLSQKMTKKYFREILDKALIQAEEEHKAAHDNVFNTSIYKQLIDIKKTVVINEQIYTEEESRKKYPLGVMVVRNFDDYLNLDWDYPKMLIDIAGGVYRYPNMPEN